jgi:hypothetical protein
MKARTGKFHKEIDIVDNLDSLLSSIAAFVHFRNSKLESDPNIPSRANADPIGKAGISEKGRELNCPD